MIRSAQNLKVRGVLCVLRFVRVVDLSMSHHGGRDECGMSTGAPGLPLSVTQTGVCGGVVKCNFAWHNMLSLAKPLLYSYQPDTY